MRWPELFDHAIRTLHGWAKDLFALLPNLTVATIIVVVTVIVSRFVRRLVLGFVGRFSHNPQLPRLAAGVARVGILAGGIFIALGTLKLDKTVMSLLAGVGIIGLALGFAFKDIAANFMSGVILAIEQQYRLHDLVKIKDHFGVVHDIDLRETTIRVQSGQLVAVPNEQVLQNPITNFTRSGERRVELEVGVSYEADLERAQSVALAALEGVPDRDASRPVEALYTAFADSAITLELRFWLKSTDQKAFLLARSNAIIAVKKAFAGARIDIPCPINPRTRCQP